MSPRQWNGSEWVTTKVVHLGWPVENETEDERFTRQRAHKKTLKEGTQPAKAEPAKAAPKKSGWLKA